MNLSEKGFELTTSDETGAAIDAAAYHIKKLEKDGELVPALSILLNTRLDPAISPENASQQRRPAVYLPPLYAALVSYAESEASLPAEAVNLGASAEEQQRQLGWEVQLR